METFKRVVSLLLCFVMLVGVVPFGAMATETTEPETAETLPVVEETEEVTGLVGSTEATEAATEEETSAPTEGEETEPTEGEATEPTEVEVTEPTEVETLPIITDEGGAIDLQAVTEAANNYPEYPDQGAVRVNKTGTGIDFQSTGIAQVEISATGVPLKKGADIIVMVDTSSSMERHVDCGEKSCNKNTCSKVTRQQELVNALESLVDVFQTRDTDGNYQDLKIAFADFNGFFGDRGDTKFEGQKVAEGSPYDLDTNDYTDAAFSATGDVHVIQGSALNYNAFMTPAQLSNVDFDEFNTASGTNYDYAFDVIYQLGHAAREYNTRNGDADRELYVIFMSDGAPNQFNYFGAVGGSNGSSKKWDNWLKGTWTQKDLTSSNLKSITHSYYYDLNDHDGDGYINEHRMANAIKGDPSKTYEVIRKSTAGLTDLLPQKSDNNLYQLPGLGATMFSIAFAPANDGDIDRASMIHALQQIASDATGNTQYYYEVEAGESLTDVFKAIGTDITYAAYNARFVDKMGPAYDLKLGKLVDLHGESLGVQNKIEILSYDIYTVGETRPAGKNVGDRKGTYTVLETITFNDDGTAVYSDKIDNGTTNILGADGIIYAKYFYYNTTAAAVAVPGVNIPTGVDKETNLTTGSTNMLPSETFYWKMGTVNYTEMAMRYYVYLTGSMEGKCNAGSYPTNEYANLYYDNYLGNPCVKETVSPVLPWLDANVTYVFYLVDENGNIIVNQATGTTGSFPYRIAVTTPVTISNLKLNGEANTCKASDVKDVLPNGYELYDEAATYTVKINSDGTGEWWIVRGTDKAATTYVTQYNGDAYTNVENSTNSGDYTHTVVWFAVKWTGELTPDTVVVDFGLPVDIDVSTNDEVSGVDGKLYGISLDKQPVDTNNNNAAMNTGVYRTPVMGNGTVDHNSITAAKNGDLVRVQIKDTQFHEPVTFRYEVSVNTGNSNIGYMYSKVTVIPATTIYYEDSFVQLSSYTKQDDGTYTKDTTSKWTASADPTATQAQDRPGANQIGGDADNLYGYDGAYTEMSQYSMGSAAKIDVVSGMRGEATFTFFGTGFDIIGLTSNTTGTLVTKVYQHNENGAVDLTASPYKSTMVDTYYGYAYGDQDQDGDNEWYPVPSNTDNALYQVPVMKISGLPYAQYTVVLNASYNSIFDHTGGNDNKYTLYLDAIRIYDPTGNNDTTATNAYIADGEAYPTYTELRNQVISATDYENLEDKTTAVLNGAVFIDGASNVASVADYVSYGPNNELYLAKDQAIAFTLASPRNMAKIQLALKTVGGTSHIEVYGADNVDEKTLNLDVETATDLYYDITALAGKTVVIKNTGNGILSLTNIKTTYTAAPVEATELLSVDYASVSAALLSLRAPVVEEEPSVPETEPVFAPEKFQVKVSKKSVEAGKQVDVVVTTSADVDAVSIDGQMVTGKYDKKKNVYTWTARIQTDAGDVGTMTIEVVAYDEDGVASEAESVDVTVTAKKGKEVKKK